jgi:hypothetical protein
MKKDTRMIYLIRFKSKRKPHVAKHITKSKKDENIVQYYRIHKSYFGKCQIHIDEIASMSRYKGDEK